MQIVHDVDALLFMATLLAAKRRPAELVEIMAAADMVHGSVPAVGKLVESFARLGAAGLLQEVEGGFVLSPAGQELVQELPRKPELQEQLEWITRQLHGYRAGEAAEPIVLAAEQFSVAINAHRAAAQGTGKNLLMPKPRPADTQKKRPGQRQRRPLPGQRPKR